MGASEKLAEKLQSIGESSLHRGEELRGVLACSSARLYGAKTFVLVVTDKRLVIQPTTRSWLANGMATPVHPEEVAEYEITPMAKRLFGRRSPGFVLKIRTVDDRPLDLMGWTGDGWFGRFGGGKPQSSGHAALQEWLAAIDMGDSSDERV